MSAPSASQPQSTPSPSAPPVGVFTLLWWTLMAVIAMGGLLSGGLIVLNNQDVWHAFLPALAVGVTSAFLGVFPLAITLRGTYTQIMVGWLGGMGLRAMGTLAGLTVVVLILHYPRIPAVLMVTAYYFAVLAVDTVLLVRGLNKNSRVVTG